MPGVFFRFKSRSARAGRLLPWLALAGLPWASAVQAQAERFQCARLAASTSRAPAYGQVPGQPRCEGFYERNVSQPFLEVVSLTRSSPGSWAADEQGRLSLRGASKVDVRLLIQPMRSNPLYRVDAWLARGDALAWDSTTMLSATGLRLRDLGLLAQAGAGAQPLALAPVSVQGGEGGIDNNNNGNTAYAVLRPSVTVSSLAWRGYRLNGSSPLAGTWQDLTTTPLFAWERIVLPIPLPPDGRGLRVDVRGLDSKGQALPLLQFVVIGALDDAAP